MIYYYIIFKNLKFLYQKYNLDILIFYLNKILLIFNIYFFIKIMLIN